MAARSGIKPVTEKPTVWEANRLGLIRTYGDLIRVARHSSEQGTCCACHAWDRRTWKLSTRASICEECCRRKADEVLGSIAKAERKARRYAKQIVERGEGASASVQFYARLAGVSESFMRDAIAAIRS